MAHKILFLYRHHVLVSSYDRQKMDLLNIKDQQLEISLSLEDITDNDRSRADLISLINHT
jgi:hypothetical protein